MRKVFFLLGQLRDEDVEWLTTHGTKEQFAAGTVLVHEGRSVDTLYVLLVGTLEVTGRQLGDKPVRLGSGEVVGEVSLLDSRPPTATVTAADDCTVLALPRSVLMEKMDEDDAFAARVYKALALFLAHRLRNTYQRLGYGKETPLDEDEEYADELSPELLDSVHLAGARFDRTLQRLLGD